MIVIDAAGKDQRTIRQQQGVLSGDTDADDMLIGIFSGTLTRFGAGKLFSTPIPSRPPLPCPTA